MSWTRLLAIARKETIQIGRDPRSLIVVLLMPVMLMALMGYGINLDQKHVPLCVYDREGSQQSQDLLHRFTSNEYFELALDAHDYRELTDAIDRGTCAAGIVIPLYFSKRLGDGETVGVQAIVDGTDNNSAYLAIGYAQQVIGGFSSDVQLDTMRRAGGTINPPSLTVEARTWFNEELVSRNFMVPGVVAIVMAVIGTFLTSLTIAREWERGTMEQLISTPVTRSEVIAGKLVPYFAIGMFAAVECVAISTWWFEVPFRGSFMVLFCASALFLMAVLLLGFLISAAAGSQLAASQFSLVLTFLPSFLLSGFAFPIDQMPAPIRLATRLIPARYYVTLLKNIFLKGSGLAAIADQMAAMALFALIFGVLTIRAFKKQLA